MKINENLTSINRNIGRAAKIEYLVIHYTANDGDTAWGNTSYFKSVYRGASAHFFVDEIEVWRSVRDEDTSWHCGTSGAYKHLKCRNSNSIGIELCSRVKSGGVVGVLTDYYIKDEVIKNAIELVKILMKKYNIPLTNILMHNDVTGKHCPAPFVYDIKQWESFKALLSSDTTPSKSTEYTIQKSNVITAVNLGIINSPEYWYAQTHIQYLNDLFANAVKLGVCDKNIDNGIFDVEIAFNVLNDAGVVTTSDYWRNILKDKVKNPWIETLLISIANKCRIVLEKIVHAEAEGEGLVGQEYVANVILNRHKHPKHLNGVYNIVFEPKQFTPVQPNGRYYSAVPSTSVKQAVTNVLRGKDNSKGVTYFCTVKSATKPGGNWHENSLNLTFKFEHKNHRFYAEI